MSFEIRTAQANDAFAACDVLRRSIIECCAADHRNDPAILEAWLGNKTPQMVAGWFASSTNFPLIAVERGAIIGVTLLTRAGKLPLCHLLPEARRRGVGTALLAAAEAQAVEWGVKAVQVLSTAGAEAFFLRRGYLSSGQMRAPYGVDAFFLWKPLGADQTAPDVKRKRFCNCNMV